MSGAFPTSPAPSSVRVRSYAPTLVSTAHSLRRIPRSRGSHRWLLEAKFPPMYRATVAPLWAFIVAQRGQFEAFTFVIPQHNTRGTGNGTPVVDGAGQSGRAVLTRDWAASETVMKAGDFVKFAGHAKVYMLTADVTSDGAGGATVNIEPALRESPVDGAALTIDSVPFTVALADDAFDVDIDVGLRYGFSLSLVESP